MKIEYDRWGRMNYNPEFHEDNSKRWSKEDIQYLIDWYAVAGPEEMSFALGRTVKTVHEKVNQLKKQGLMSRDRAGYHRRIKKETLERVQK